MFSLSACFGAPPPPCDHLHSCRHWTDPFGLSNLANPPPSQSIIMTSHVVSEATHLPPAVLRKIATAGPLDEISNIPDAVRSHIFWHGKRDPVTSKLRNSMLFCVYQTTRDGSQNGFRLCLVHRAFYIASESGVHGGPEDDVDRLEAFNPEGHMEVLVLGAAAEGQSAGEEDAD